MSEPAKRFRPVHQLLLGLIVLALFGAFTIAVKRNLIFVERDTRRSTELHRHAIENPVMTSVFTSVTWLSERPSFALEGVAGALILTAGRKWRACCIWGLAFLGEPLSSQIKELMGRARPVFDDVPTITTRSYPSGHAVGSMLIFGTALYLIARTRPRLALAVAPLVGGLILAIGFSRVYLGVHWPSDVLGGYLFGLGWLLTAAGIVQLATERRRGAAPIPVPRASELQQEGGKSPG
ncbi:MAG: phosphatase PAP2 family protein [Gemmataceae bacterium]